MGNAGEARLDVVALGRDEVTVLMNKVSGELDALKGKLAGYEKANRSAASGSDAATTSMGKFAQIAADASKKIGNIGSAIVGGAIGGMGAGVIGALVDLGRNLVSGAVDFLTWTAAGDASARATKVWEQHQKDFNSAIERTQQLLNKTSGGPLEQQLSEVNVALSVAKNLLADMEKGTEEWRKKSAEVERLTVAQEDLQRNMAADSKKTAENWERVKRAMAEAAVISVDLVGPFTGNADDLGLHHDLAGTAYTDEQWAARQKAQKEAADKARAAMNRRGGSTRPSQQSNPLDSPFLTSDRTGLPSGWEASSGGPEPLEDITYEMMPALATDTEKAAAAFDKLAKSMGAIDEKLPGLSGAFADISDIWANTDKSAKSMAGGVIGSVDAIATAGAAWFKDEKARTRFLGAKELLLAAPLWFIDPAQAAVKTATGLGLLALAGGGGGGSGGGARGGAGGGSSGGGGGGPTTIVNNFSMGIGDRQTITVALRQSARTSAGTGQSSRSGV